jgi:hypothetical protein
MAAFRFVDRTGGAARGEIFHKSALACNLPALPLFGRIIA